MVPFTGFRGGFEDRNRDNRWIAVSSHGGRRVLLFENTDELNLHSEPLGALRNGACPRGVRFTPDDEFVLVADPGAPFRLPSSIFRNRCQMQPIAGGRGSGIDAPSDAAIVSGREPERALAATRAAPARAAVQNGSSIAADR